MPTSGKTGTAVHYETKARATTVPSAIMAASCKNTLLPRSCIAALQMRTSPVSWVYLHDRRFRRHMGEFKDAHLQVPHA